MIQIQVPQNWYVDPDDHNRHARRTLNEIAVIQVEWHAGVISAQEAMLAISEVFRKATAK